MAKVELVDQESGDHLVIETKMVANSKHREFIAEDTLTTCGLTLAFRNQAWRGQYAKIPVRRVHVHAETIPGKFLVEWIDKETGASVQRDFDSSSLGNYLQVRDAEGVVFTTWKNDPECAFIG